MKVSILLTVLSSALAGPAYAQADDLVRVYVTGEKLTANCRAYLATVRAGSRATAQQAFDAGNCWGFVAGVLEAADFEGMTSTASDAPKFCLPNNVNTNILVEIVAQYGDQNPSSQRMPGYYLTRLALSESFPCT